MEITIGDIPSTSMSGINEFTYIENPNPVFDMSWDCMVNYYVKLFENRTNENKQYILYSSETLGVEVPESGDVICDCCGYYHPIREFVGAHVTDTITGTVYIYPTCDTCNKKYKESLAPEHPFYALIEWLCPLPPKQDNQSDE